VLITIGSRDAINANGLTMYNISGDIGWEKMEAMSLSAKR